MRALFSVSDKTGVVEFARQLESLGWEIIATGGTMKLLQEAGLKIISISEVTGFPEICDGRVKTLHPKVHGALLGRRDLESHRRQLQENGIEYIDLVCVNLYPFRETISKPDVTMEDAIENIDIGGPSMLRSAAKNWKDVTVVCHPEDYQKIIDEIRETGNTTAGTRLRLSAEAYTHTAEYDMMIASYMRKQAGLNEKLFLEYDLKQSLRYGENPHQEAMFYASMEKVPFSLATAIRRAFLRRTQAHESVRSRSRKRCPGGMAEDIRGRQGQHLRRNSGLQQGSGPCCGRASQAGVP